MTEIEQQERRQRLKDDLEFYARNCLYIRTKDAAVEPLSFNAAQRYLHERLEEQRQRTGKVRALTLKGRQQGCCLDPSTRVLTADLRWVEIGSVLAGDRLVAVDEQTSSLRPGAGGGRGRRMRTSTVVAAVHFMMPTYRITLDDGVQLVCTGLHRWLVRKSQTQWAWRAIEGVVGDNRDGIRVGDKLRSITRVWGESSLDDAWFGGMIDGEGSLDCSPSRTGVRLAISQRSGAVLDRMEGHCRERMYGHYIVSDDGPRRTKLGLDPVHAVNLSSLSEMFRAIGLSRPVRFLGKEWWDGKSMPDNGERTIVAIEPEQEREVVDIQTSTGTFLANGIVSHNSTYVEARFYHRVTHSHGVQAFILTHEDEASKNIFGMAQRFHGRSPAWVRPQVNASNARELLFGRLDSGYRVATAGTKDTGRSATIQLFHGSEVAFWPHADDHAAGALQAVPDAPGTEIILESTSAGPSGWFYRRWQEASKGVGDFIAVFIPWFWQAEYRRPVDPDFAPTAEEQEYQRLYGVDLEQLSWRRAKVVELGGVWHFRREYPATPEEAFNAEVPGALWTRSLIDTNRRDSCPPLKVSAIAIDPSTTSKETSDECGLVWGGLGFDNHVYVCGDETMRTSPKGWATIAVNTARGSDLDMVVYESNQGGDMVPTIIHMIDPKIVCQEVHASKGKRARAEPVAALDEQGKIHHVGELPLLEDEMCTWDASRSNESPNRIDARVWLVTYLLVRHRAASVSPNLDVLEGAPQW